MTSPTSISCPIWHWQPSSQHGRLGWHWGELPEAYQLVHGTTDHVLGHDDGTGNREDGAMRLLVLGSHGGGSLGGGIRRGGDGRGG